jgi:hypothetical protein
MQTLSPRRASNIASGDPAHRAPTTTTSNRFMFPPGDVGARDPTAWTPANSAPDRPGKPMTQIETYP